MEKRLNPRFPGIYFPAMTNIANAIVFNDRADCGVGKGHIGISSHRKRKLRTKVSARGKESLP